MADITLKLIWYRLGEGYSNMADRWEKFSEWYEDFSWRRVDILDMLFLGWLIAAFLVVGAINIYLKFFGKAKRRGDAWAGLGAGGALASISPGEGESCQWVNSVLSWLYLHYDHTPEFVEGWLKSLNEQARKHSGEVQVKFDRLQAGSLPPKFTRVHTESSDKDTLTLQASVESAEVSFVVSTLQQQGPNMKVSNCDVAVTKLSGQLRVVSHYYSDTIDVSAGFISPPEIKLLIKPKASDADPRTIEKVVRQAISGATATFSLSPIGGLSGYPALGAKTDQSQTSAMALLCMTSPIDGTSFTPPCSSPPLLPVTCYMHEQKVSNFVASLSIPSLAPLRKSLSMVLPAQPSNSLPRKRFSETIKIPAGSKAFSLRDRRLLVKVIKANGLGDKDFGCRDPYCLVSMDNPQQKHTTSVVRNTINPFWDEHFLFDLDDMTKHIKFEIFDREKPPGEDFLGRSMIAMTDLRRMPSSRQIIPLSGKVGTSSTVTVEFLFMDPAEAQQMSLSPRSTESTDGISPRRRIEMSRQVLPGGTVITQTRTTTEKPKDIRLDASYTDSPNRVQKTDNSLGLRAPSDYSPYSSHSSQLGVQDANSAASQELVMINGVESVAETALRELEDKRNARRPRTPTKTSTLIITGVSRGVDSVSEYSLEGENVSVASLQQDERLSIPTIKDRFGASPDFPPEGPVKSAARHQMPESTTPDDGRDGHSISTVSATSDAKGDCVLDSQGGDSHAKKLGSTDQEMKKSRSFASAIKKRFSRPNKKRSQSADRAGSLRSEHLLKPPESAPKTTDDLDHAEITQDGLRKSRSHSFSSSLKRIFRKKKKDKDYPSSRESSVSRLSARGGYDNRGSYEQSPSYRGQPSPDMPRDSARLLSTSVPVTAPIYDR